MPKKEVPVGHLQNFLPPGTADPVLSYLHQYKVHLTISRHRQSILGDYRHRTQQHNHRISVNGSLNPFSFLITLLHELAHLLAFEQYSGRIQAHGKEWKKIYGELLQQFFSEKAGGQHSVFPPDIEKELLKSLHNPAASSCAEDGLLRALRKYDTGKMNSDDSGTKANFQFIEDIAYHGLFRLTDGRVFQKGEKLRKRFKCKELATGKLYLFSPVYEVEVV